ncbi:MAG: type II toxin-antitoxin system HicB family antitoxin [bacterium]
MKKTFTLEYWTENGWFIGELKELSNVFSQAESLEELERNIQEVYSLMHEGSESPIIRHQTKEILLEV